MIIEIDEFGEIIFEDSIRYIGIFVGSNKSRLQYFHDLLMEVSNLGVPEKDFVNVPNAIYYDLNEKIFCDYIHSDKYKEIGISDLVSIIKKDYPKPKLQLGHIYYSTYMDDNVEKKSLLYCLNDDTHDKYLIDFHKDIVYTEQIKTLKDVTSEEQLKLIKECECV